MAGAPRRSTQTTFVISVAAELAGMHPQTLRQYDRLGLVTPERTKGRGRRYTQRHVEMLREVQRLSQDEGINLAGIQRILDLQQEVEALRVERDRLLERLQRAEERKDRIFAADASGNIHSYRRGQRPQRSTHRPEHSDLVPWEPPFATRYARVRATLEPPRRASRHSGGHTIIEVDGSGIRIIDGSVN